jgi:hypothetical protein
MTQYDDPIADNAAIELNSDPSVGEFIYLGLGEIAYIKPVLQDGENIFGIYAADGEQIGSASEYDLACAMTIQNDLHPLNVH